MNRALTLVALAALIAGCPATTPAPTPSASSTAKPAASPTAATSTTGTPSAAPTAGSTAGATASPTAAPAAAGDAAASIALKVAGVAVDLAPAFEYGTSGKAVSWDFGKPSRGYTAADKWWVTVTINGKTMAANAPGFTAADVSAVAVVFRQGTGATSKEKNYSVGSLESTAYAIADGKLDVTFKGMVELSSTTGSSEKIDVDFTLRGAPIK